MLTTLAVKNYRSLLDIVVPLGPLNLITGANGSGKSNLYRSLRLLAETAQGGLINSLAREGGLESSYWAGPETLSRRMRTGEVPVQGQPMSHRKRLRLGFAGDDFGYSISLGLPSPSASAFVLDPEIKRECIWAGPSYRAAASLVDRTGPVVKVRDGRRWQIINQHMQGFDSLFSQVADAKHTPEVVKLRETIRAWRFYDHFRSDAHAPARQSQLGTRTPVLHHDGRDLAAAMQTIRETGNPQDLDAAIADAFPGASLNIVRYEDGRFALQFHQHGLLRTLTGAELSDGTLRYLLWVAALLTPRPPSLMVLNEPETSLHPDLLPALARLIIQASKQSQVWVVSHASRLINTLSQYDGCHFIELEKELGDTQIAGQDLLNQPPWTWPDARL